MRAPQAVVSIIIMQTAASQPMEPMVSDLPAVLICQL
jgi:hypothetical protein